MASSGRLKEAALLRSDIAAESSGPGLYTLGVSMATSKIGSVMVIGGGITGMQAALDLADSGYYVYLVEETSSIGGMMSQLDKTFPTNDCAM